MIRPRIANYFKPFFFRNYAGKQMNKYIFIIDVCCTKYFVFFFQIRVQIAIFLKKQFIVIHNQYLQYMNVMLTALDY